LPIVDIPDRGDAYHEMWVELMRLTEEQPALWTLIGAHMVALHGWAHGRDAIRPSRDADILVDVRVVTKGVHILSRALIRDGYVLSDKSVGGLGHSFARGEVSFDVLAPDGLGSRVRLTTVDDFRTVMVPGGSQALRRTARMRVRSRSESGIVPVPDLLGAILVKIRAIGVDDEPDAQRSDVAFLLTLVDDPDELAAECSAPERRWLRRHPYLENPDDDCWTGISGANDGVLVYRRLIVRT
jgi:hypothetical protein